LLWHHAPIEYEDEHDEEHDEEGPLGTGQMLRLQSFNRHVVIHVLALLWMRKTPGLPTTFKDRENEERTIGGYTALKTYSWRKELLKEGPNRKYWLVFSPR
jgi:hypothetical protein